MSAVSCVCGDPVHGGRTVHDCCARNGAGCAACRESRKAEREWMRRSRVCPDCHRRSIFPLDVCPPCDRRRDEDGGTE